MKNYKKWLMVLLLCGMLTPVLAFTTTNVTDLQTNWNTYENTTVNFNGTFLFAEDDNYAFVEDDGYVIEIVSLQDYNLSSYSREDRLNITGYAWVSCLQYDKNKRRISIGNYTVCPDLYNGSVDDSIGTLASGYSITPPETVTNMSDYDNASFYGKYIKSEQLAFKDFGLVISTFWYADWYDLQNSNKIFNTFDDNRIDNSTLYVNRTATVTGFVDNYLSPYIHMDIMNVPYITGDSLCESTPESSILLNLSHVDGQWNNTASFDYVVHPIDQSITLWASAGVGESGSVSQYIVINDSDWVYITVNVDVHNSSDGIRNFMFYLTEDLGGDNRVSRLAHFKEFDIGTYYVRRPKSILCEYYNATSDEYTYPEPCPEVINSTESRLVIFTDGQEDWSANMTISNFTLHKGESEYNSRDCALQLNTVEEMSEFNIADAWVDFNATAFPQMTLPESWIIVCTIFPSFCFVPTIFGDESGYLTWTYHYPYTDQETYLEALFNGTDMRQYINPTGYFNIQCKNDIVFGWVGTGRVIYADCNADYDTFRTKISDITPIAEQPAVLNFGDSIPISSSHTWANVKYPITFDSVDLLCRKGINATHYQRIQLNGTTINETRPWNFYGFDNYTTANQTMLSEIGYCAIQSGTTNQLTIYGDADFIESQYASFKSNYEGTTKDVLCLGHLYNDPPDRATVNCFSGYFDEDPQSAYFSSAIIEDTICHNLESSYPYQINFESACRFGGLTGYAVAVNIQQVQLLMVIVGIIIILTSVTSLVIVDFSISQLLIVVMGIAFGIAMVLFSISVVISP